MDMQELEDDFAFLDGWEERYSHVIELGKALPPFDEACRSDANKVSGCVSQVWLTMQADEAGRFHFTGDSDAHIVRGLVAVVIKILQDKTAREILDTDIQGFFARIGLADNLSSQRANGLQAMIDRIHKAAEAAVQAGKP